MRRRARKRQKKKEYRRPILKRLRAAFLRSFRGAARRKMVCVRGVPGVTGTLGKANSHFEPSQTRSGTAPPRWGGCWLVEFNFACFIYCTYDRNFALHYSERLESIRVLEMNRRSVLMIRVKVNSKSEFVEDREGKFALYLCNLLWWRHVNVESCNMWSYGLDLRLCFRCKFPL